MCMFNTEKNVACVLDSYIQRGPGINVTIRKRKGNDYGTI